jgi:hypothetical protein
MIHTAIMLPIDLIEQLKRDGQAAGHGLSTEIRDRLRRTYSEQSSDDPKTSSLIDDIRSLSGEIEHNVRRKWHEHAYALALFTFGVSYFLGREKPPGDPNRRPDATSEGPDDPPDVVGRTLARQISDHHSEEIGILAGPTEEASHN